MDRFKVVQKGYHGLRELSKEEIRALYQQKKIRPATGRYHWIDTLYALSEATLYAGIVDAFEQRGIPSTTRASSPTSASASTRPTATAPSSTR
jgi:5'-nucleotidase